MANLCGAKARSNGGAPCRQPAGFGTWHPGTGRCKFHGGAVPVKHGRRSKVNSATLGELRAQWRRERFEAVVDEMGFDLVRIAEATVRNYVDRQALIRRMEKRWGPFRRPKTEAERLMF